MDERFIVSANRYWWAYRIAFEFSINPQDVKKWHAHEIMEALAAIGIKEKAEKKAANAAKKG
ncbi:putative tail assembly chaperone [Bacillus phage vB_BcM_Sam46]|uniref:Putative tail assembly chaperone n=2 Tax=Caudoviricetes TaxID=2731619 RepID=A0A6G9L982_9CAUD|nr:putative tail assembly chaperone [Bacillus phage vB_BcM_Sam112]QIQ61216.1 putative tail assembly chaperone [Bacillus phage vB_BcM_Sam46]